MATTSTDEHQGGGGPGGAPHRSDLNAPQESGPPRAVVIEDMRRYWDGWSISADGCTATLRLRCTGEIVTMTAPTPEALDTALYIARGD